MTASAAEGASAAIPAFEPEELYGEPNGLARHYSRFRVAGRLLLTGHSHQAWPDCGFDGQRRAWEDAARLVDAKWEEAFARADRVRAGFAALLGAPGQPGRRGLRPRRQHARTRDPLPLRALPARPVRGW